MRKARLAGVLAALALSGAAQAELFDRGGGMIYDSNQNVTWLSDMNYAKSSGFVADGLMYWNQAASWVANLEFGGYSDWRMPTASLDADGLTACRGFNCTGGELANLFFDELDVTPGAPTSTGDPSELALFTNVAGYGVSWTGFEVGFPVFFTTQVQGDLPTRGPSRFDGLPLVVVRDGDVGVVPEPETYALFLAGLAWLAMARRRRPG